MFVHTYVYVCVQQNENKYKENLIIKMFLLDKDVPCYSLLSKKKKEMV